MHRPFKRMKSYILLCKKLRHFDILIQLKSFKKVTWNIGDILHMSMTPDPRYWPRLTKRQKAGMPKTSERSRNWTTNTAAEKKYNFEKHIYILSGKWPHVRSRWWALRICWPRRRWGCSSGRRTGSSACGAIVGSAWKKYSVRILPVPVSISNNWNGFFVRKKQNSTRKQITNLKKRWRTNNSSRKTFQITKAEKCVWELQTCNAVPQNAMIKNFTWHFLASSSGVVAGSWFLLLLEVLPPPPPLLLLLDLLLMVLSFLFPLLLLLLLLFLPPLLPRVLEEEDCRACLLPICLEFFLKKISVSLGKNWNSNLPVVISAVTAAAVAAAAPVVIVAAAAVAGGRIRICRGSCNSSSHWGRRIWTLAPPPGI